MKIAVYDRPCLLLETLELVHAWFNDIHLDELTEDDPVCIPGQELLRIQREVCMSLDRKDPELQFYFSGIYIPCKLEKSITSIALNLLHFNQDHRCEEIDDAIRALKDDWKKIPPCFHVSGMDAATIRIETTEEYTSLPEEIAKLPVPPEYQLKLLDGFSRYEYHVERLGEILKPLGDKLLPLLEPWIEKAAPRRLGWANYFKEPDAMPKFQKMCDLSMSEVEAISIVLGYVTPRHGSGLYTAEPLCLHMRMGTAFVPGVQRDRGKEPLDDGILTALRLMSRQECIDIFRVTKGRHLCIQDIAKELGMNPGTVFRNVNSMFNVGLLSLDILSGRNYYKANPDRLDYVVTRLQRYAKDE